MTVDEAKLKELKSIRQNIAYTADLLHGDITIITLLESLAEGVVIINEAGKIVLINNRFYEMTGFSKEDAIGEELSIFICDDLHERHQHHLQKFFKNPRIRPMGIGMELTAKKKDGSIFPVEISLSHLQLESSKIGVGFITDISNRKLAIEELKIRNAELDAYAHTVAHDLSSSLMGIVGISDLLVDPELSLEKDKRDMFIKEISNRGRKMYDVIRELLIFSSMRKEEVKTETVDMRKVVDSACNRLKYNIEQNSADITISDEMLDCKTYEPWIEEIWYNFISNAIKYGGQPPKIKIKSEKVGSNQVKYSVIDSGVGISDEFKKIIFDQNSGKRDALTKGFGLGLTIVKRIIDKLEGTVTVDSEIGKGSTFSFILDIQ